MTAAPTSPTMPTDREPPGAWPAVIAMAAGFFMIMLDTTIVSVSIPSIMSALHADVTQVIWVSSAYLLTYAIPLLITGRLGDRFGPKNMYLLGLLIFTATSFWCGMSGSIHSLIAARAVQGIGAALMSPQTMAVITRMFPPHRRGGPMGLWGSTASVAGLAGPLLGGLLVDSWGWKWIFFVNVPIGLITMLAVWKCVPQLETHGHKFDMLGVALNAVGLTLLVFGIQEGQAKSWPAWIIAMIVAGVVVMALFVVQQGRSTGEPLMPLELFKNRNFSASNAAIFVMGACIVALSFPMMLYLQSDRGLSPTRAALLNLPSAVVSFVGAPVIGKLTNTRPTRGFTMAGFAILSAGLFAQAALMKPDVRVLWLLVPSFFLGISACLIWGPLSMSATRDLPRKWAGAGSGVYNATRQLGSVLGSALIAMVIEWQLSSHMPGGSGGSTQAEGAHAALPAFLQAPFAEAMRHATWFPAGAALLALVASSFLVKPNFLQEQEAASGQAGGGQVGAGQASGGRAMTGGQQSAPVTDGASTGTVPSGAAPAGQRASSEVAEDRPGERVTARRGADDGVVRPRRAMPE